MLVVSAAPSWRHRCWK
ncbi:hypothetical protein E2C01_088008 [Portunus trituberculatus]|uniref:Uncharacterized protein n=1 Tax=Portunus trituberculatus TaxID=210409 RepID=A0A5B7JE81_PORTR|nr:hypothetical protein [Portunus trituberculatus]